MKRKDYLKFLKFLFSQYDYLQKNLMNNHKNMKIQLNENFHFIENLITLNIFYYINFLSNIYYITNLYINHIHFNIYIKIHFILYFYI